MSPRAVLACLSVCLCVSTARAALTPAEKANLWSLKPLTAATPPSGRANPIDGFVLAKLKEKGLEPSPPADRRTLIRRVYYDLSGLPPTPQEIEQFVASTDPQAYERLIDRLLASPAYGERWARHWLDCVHYGDTHGYDKDKIRPNAWPYRDYVIRALNDDKPYAQFVKEQLAGDVFYPGTRDGVAALGFLAAGPWDFVGQAEVREGTLEKQRVRNIDRDDMVSVTMNTFVSLTAQCARCHDHKFDPITQKDYYSLQADFAAIDRADRPFDADPAIANKRRELARQRVAALAQRDALTERVRQACGGELASLDQQIAGAAAQGRPEYGYHSAIELQQDKSKWVQVDLGAATIIDRVVVAPCYDTFNDIGAGFGFPVRYKVEASNDSTFTTGITVLANHTAADVKNPGTQPQITTGTPAPARFIRITATKLAPRLNDFIFAIAELRVIRPDGADAARGAAVSSLDSIEALPRWSRANLVDGVYPAAKNVPISPEIGKLKKQRETLIESRAGSDVATRLQEAEQRLAATTSALAALPAPALVVFAGATDFEPSGEFRATYGKPRPIHLLARGGENAPRDEMSPGTIGAAFNLPKDHDESARRAALAKWIVDRNNPLTWRSIVNRAWYYHFGRGIVETPNDFGHMGAEPTHPELLDWLAADFRDHGGSLKRLHRLIVNSETYRQSSANNPAAAKIDAGNQWLWRQNRRRLDAESVWDTVLSVTGLLDRTAGGPGFKAFGFEDDHSPRYKYAEFNPDDPAAHRRAIYRLIVRSAPDPFMETLDCADPSQIVERRNETLTALQALALLNNRFMVRMAERFAERLEKAENDPVKQIELAYRLAIGRAASDEESTTILDIARRHGLPNACRLIFNTNEFVFVD